MPPGPLPTFVVIGAAKAGTTSLWYYLRAHPQVFMCSPKEPEFFVSEGSWARGIDWYRTLFAEGAAATAVGEASTSYSWFPRHKWVPGRMREIIPEVRLVYLIRNPIDRMISMFRFRVDLGLETRSIDEALTDPLYVEPSLYAMQIDQYLEHFDRTQLLVLTSDELSTRRDETLGRVYRFIGVDDLKAPKSDVMGEFNRAEDHRRRYRFVPRVRGTKIYWLARRVLPSNSPIFSLAYRLLTRRASTPAHAVQPSQDTRRRALELLAPDLERLPGILGPEFHCWGLLGAKRD